MFIVIIEGPGQVRKDMKIKPMLMYVDNQQQHGHKDKEMIGRMDMFFDLSTLWPPPPNILGPPNVVAVVVAVVGDI